jgi:pimeloyl-ACP methyl ester carboxylesterase
MTQPDQELFQPGLKDSRGYYYIGQSTVFASKVDQRFSYCLYVPLTYPERSGPLPLVVLQHGTGRKGPQYRDNFSQFAEDNHCVVLAPLFPAGIDDPDDLHNFKFIRYHDIRFDLVLLAMVEEVAERLDIEADRFLLHGFSGGGQFAHRFFYLHPDRLLGVSIGAPGRITLIDPSQDWWLGWKSMADFIGAEPKRELLPSVPVHMVVGAMDVETWEINNPGDSNWMDGAEKAGNTRIERLQTLRRNFADNGIAVRFDIVPNVAHEPMKVLEPVMDFFHKVLNAKEIRS